MKPTEAEKTRIFDDLALKFIGKEIDMKEFLEEAAKLYVEWVPERRQNPKARHVVMRLIPQEFI